MYRFGLHLPQYRVKQALRQMGLNLGTSVLDRYYRMAEDELMLKLEGDRKSTRLNSSHQD